VTLYYADTSALAKRYIIETGSRWVIQWIEPTTGNTTAISKLTFVEMRSVLARRVREQFLTPTQANLLWTDFTAHVISEYIVVTVDDRVIQRAETLVAHHSLRTLDAIQLSSALEAQLLLSNLFIFVSADNNLLAAAKAEGFVTDNPNSHP
jgi:predicted nucleic acid-binding protein